MRLFILGLSLFAVGSWGCSGKSVRLGSEGPDDSPREVPLVFMTGDVETDQFALHALDADGTHRMLGRAAVPENTVKWLEKSLFGSTDLFMEPSPDGRFVAWSCPRCFTYDSEKSKLWIFDSAGKKPPFVPTNRVTINSQLEWSPDGRWLVISNYDLVTGPEVLLADPSGEVSPFEMPQDMSNRTWAPDGSTFAYTLPGSRDGTVNLYTHSLDGTGREIARDVGFCGPVAEEQNLWSPDGTRLLYIEGPVAARTDPSAVFRIRAAKVDGSGTDTLFEAPWSEYEDPSFDAFSSFFCSWTRDSSRVLLRATQPDRIISLQLADRSARTLVQPPKLSTFVAKAGYRPFLESPSGEHLAYAAEIGGSLVLRTIDLNGQNEREWASVPHDREGISWIWSAQGRHAFLRLHFDDRTEIYSADLDAGQSFPLTVQPLVTDQQAVGFSPDESHVVFQRLVYWNPETWEARMQYVATRPDGSDEVPMPSGTFGYMADGRHIAAAEANAISLQETFGEPPRVAWQAADTVRLFATRFPID